MTKIILKSSVYGLSLSFKIQIMGQIAWQLSQEVNCSHRIRSICFKVVGLSTLLQARYRIIRSKLQNLKNCWTATRNYFSVILLLYSHSMDV